MQKRTQTRRERAHEQSTNKKGAAEKARRCVEREEHTHTHTHTHTLVSSSLTAESWRRTARRIANFWAQRLEGLWLWMGSCWVGTRGAVVVVAWSCGSGAALTEESGLCAGSW